MLVAGNLGAVFNYVFQAMMSRNLSPSDFGLMNSLFAINGLVAIPAGIYMTAMSRRWAEWVNEGCDDSMDGEWLRWVVVFSGMGLLLSALLLCVKPLWMWWFQVNNGSLVEVAVIGAMVGTILNLAGSWLNARQWFGWLALGSLIGVWLRVGTGWLGIRSENPLTGALIATSLTGVPFMWIVLKHIRWKGWTQGSWNTIFLTWREWTAPLAASIANFLICGVDILVIRHFYPPQDSGVFAQVMLLSRIMLFLIGPLGIVVFPKSATGPQSETNLSGWVRQVLGLGGIFLGLTALGITWFGPLGFKLLRGSVDPFQVECLRIAVWTLLPLGLCQLIIPILVAGRKEKELWRLTLILGIIPLGIAIWRGNIIHAFWVEGIAGCLGIAVQFFPGTALPHSKKTP